jgi:hypothetical protein
MSNKNPSFISLIKYIISFFIERRKFKKQKLEDKFNKIQQKLDKEYREIQDRNEIKGVNNVKDASNKINNIF